VTEFLEFTVLGVAVGAAYAILATGLVVTYTTSGIFNFAHGAVAMFAAFTYWSLTQHGVPEWLGLLLVLAVGAPAFGALVEWGLMRRLYGASVERPIMVTLGLLVIMLGAADLIWNISTVRTLNPLVAGTFTLFGVKLPWQNAVLLGAAVLVAVAMRLLFARTRLGVGMRAVVDDPELVRMTGVSPNRMSRAGWMLGFFLAALAGVLIAPTLGSTFTVLNMTLLVVNAYAAAVVGRLRSVPWAFVGAIGLGLATEYFVGYGSQHFASGVGSEITTALPMIFLFVALVALPSARLEAAGRLVAARIPRTVRGRESLIAASLFVAASVVFSLFFSGTFLTEGVSTVGPIAGQTMALGLVALSLVLLIGYAGEVSLCQFAFMGIGAFCMGKVAGGDSLLGVLVAVGACAAVGVLVALPTIRLRGLYLALATFAFAEAVQLGFFADTHVLGQAGIIVGRISVAGVSFTGDRAEFILLSVVFALCAVGVLAIRRSAFGRRLVAVNDSPAACATVGLNTGITKVAVFALAAGMAGLGGAMWGSLQGTVGASNFTIFAGVIFVLFVVIWSARTVTGAFLAALTYAIFTNVSHLTKVEGIFAGVGVILIGWVANGILGIEWFGDRVHLPWVRRAPTEPADAVEPCLEPSLLAAGSEAGGPGVVS